MRLRRSRSSKILFYEFVILLIMLVVYVFLAPFLSDYNNCRKHYTFSDCFSDYLNYLSHKITGKCYLKPIEPKGIPTTNETYSLPLDIYLVNVDNFSESDVARLVDSVNEIWDDYGITFYIRNLTKIDDPKFSKLVNKDNNTVAEFAKEIMGDDLYFANSKAINVIIAEQFYDRKLSFWKWSWYSKSIAEGQGWNTRFYGNQSYLVLLSLAVENLTWDFAHELGHMLCLDDRAFYSGDLNLMTHSGCIKYKYWPTLLTQEDVDKVLNCAKGMNVFKGSS